MSHGEHWKLQNRRSQRQNTRQQICYLLITTTEKTSVFLGLPLKQFRWSLSVKHLRKLTTYLKYLNEKEKIYSIGFNLNLQYWSPVRNWTKLRHGGITAVFWRDYFETMTTYKNITNAIGSRTLIWIVIICANGIKLTKTYQQNETHSAISLTGFQLLFSCVFAEDQGSVQ